MFCNKGVLSRTGSRAVATSKMERFMIIVNGWKRFVIIVNGWKTLTIITKRSILDVAAALDLPLFRHFARFTGKLLVYAVRNTRSNRR